MKTAVIGAGPAGITAAYQLAKDGYSVDLYEAADQTGGLARTIELWGMKADIGPHRFFSHDLRVNALWLELAGKDYEMVNRLTRIYYNGKFFDYPLKPLNALKGLGFSESVRCMTSFGLQQLRPVSLNGSFENWVIQRFGRRLYTLFFKTYSEKLWGIPCNRLDDDFAAQRIKKLSLYEALKNALFAGDSGKHATLVDCFAYPNEGTGMIYRRMESKIKATGNRVLLQTPVQEVVVESSVAKGILTTGGEFTAYDQVISTMPISKLVSSMKQVPQPIKQAAGKLRFRNAIMVYLLVEGQPAFPDNWLYVHSPSLKTGRITNFRNWVPGLYGKSPDTILMLEYWCYSQDDFWSMENEELINLAKQEIRLTGLIGNTTIKDGFVLRIPKCYPVYEIGYRDVLEPVENFLDTITNLQAIGRFGAFKYNNQDHSILMGILAAENITKQAGHRLWSINTDYDTYQERSLITATGLIKT